MTIADRRQREKEQRRTEILDAAERLFFSQGYDNISMDDIANAVELNKATIYLYFKNKEALFSAVVLRGFRILNGMYRECVAMQVPGINKVVLMGNGFYRFNCQYPDYLRLIRYYGSERFSNAELPEAAAIRAITDESRSLLCEAIRQGMEDGTIRNDLDPTEITIYLMMTFMSIVSPTDNWKRIIEDNGIRSENFIRDFMQFLISALYVGEKPFTVQFDEIGTPVSTFFFSRDLVATKPQKQKTIAKKTRKNKD